MKTESSLLGALFSQKIALLISAKRPEQGTKPKPQEGTMDWAKVLLTILRSATKIAIDAINSSQKR
jgi:hypothetical protein